MRLFSSRKSGSFSSSSRPADDKQIVKRRSTIQLALLDRPLMTETEFLVEPRYRSLRLLGAGSYGVVVSALDTVTGHRVAIKKILSTFSNSHMSRHVLREVRLLRHLNHPHIVQLLDIDQPSMYSAWQDVYIVTPHLEVDLRDALLQGKLEDRRLQKRVAFQMLLALEHMHSLGIMHRDVKSRNVLLDNDKNAMLCDLGEARFYSKAFDCEGESEPKAPTREPELTGGVSTIIQSAPELALGAAYGTAVDVWAAGCVIAEMVHPQHSYLFDSTGKQSHVQEIIDIVGYPSDEILKILPDYGQWYLKKQRRKKGSRNRIGELIGTDADPVVVDLLENMMRFSPKDRLSARKALQHPWFDEVRTAKPKVVEPYDFAKSEPPKKTSKSQLKTLVWGEMLAFHPEAAQGKR